MREYNFRFKATNLPRYRLGNRINCFTSKTNITKEIAYLIVI